MRSVKGPSPTAQLSRSLAKYTPEIAALARSILARMRARLPGATELVYDNYNALVIGFGPSERASEAIFSVAVYPKWVNLFFLQGASLSDPRKLLKGSGKIVRRVVINTALDWDEPGVQSLISQALARAKVPMDESGRRRLVIRSISVRQRPRRPA